MSTRSSNLLFRAAQLLVLSRSSLAAVNAADVLTVQFTGNSTSSCLAQGTAFSYHGRLADSGNPAAGNYDFQFTIYDASASGNVVAGPETIPASLNQPMTIAAHEIPTLLTHQS